ncbi:MAG: PAS domain S-box-containing protein [Desulforhopalus sp.]|jgi:PAS domain S-box-containing protein
MFIKILSLRAKLLLWLMPIILVGLVSMSSGAYFYFKSVIEEELSKSMLASVGKSAESINRWLSIIMLEPEAIASTPAAKAINENFSLLDNLNLNRHKRLHAKYPDIFKDIYAANKDGEYHTIIQIGDNFTIHKGNIVNRPYFQAIMSGAPTQITSPLISRTTGISTVFLVSPIHDEENQPIGLIGSGISLSYIQNIAQTLKAGLTGYGFILADDGTYIYHPNDSLIMKSKITELDNPALQKLGRRMISGKSGIFSYSYDGQEMVALHFPIPITGWSVATVLPEIELFAPAVNMVKILLAITVFFSLIVGFAIIFAMDHLTRPLKSLVSRAQEISSGNLKVPALEIQTEDEIGKLAGAFNLMTTNLNSTLSGLQKSEDKYRSIFENSLLGIIQVSIEGNIISANPAFVQMLGYESLEKMLDEAKNVQTSMYLNPEDRTKILEELLQKGKLQNQEIQLKHRNGDSFWVSIDIRLIRDQAGAPLRIESLVNDINNRIEAEQERSKLQSQLAQSQKLEAVGKLAGGVAHDFNNILSVIIGKSEIALMKMAPSAPFYASFVDIKKAAEHSASLTRQLLTFARKQTIAPQVVDINQNMQETLSMLRRIISENIDLTQSPSPGLWPVKMDPDQMTQIITNLCVNARDAIDKIGTIIIKTTNSTLDKEYYTDLSDYIPGDYVCLSVSDDGCGMDPETQKQIFEPFFTTKGQHKGTGLGLATVYGIVKQNHGFINIYSEVNQGTTFKIYIPKYTGNDAHRALNHDKHDTPRGDESILLVEDEPELLDVSEQMLKELGYTVLAVNSPEEAIRYAEQYGEKIDLLLTDVIMPKMNGRDLATYIHELHPHMQCLFMSGYTADIIAHQGVLDEGIDFLQKPFSVQALAGKVRAVIDAGGHLTRISHH